MKTPWIAAGAVIALIGLAVVSGSYWQVVLTLAVVYALASLSLVVLTGWTGQLNLHLSALGLGWGAYATYALMHAHVPPDLAIAFAFVLTIPFAAVVAAIAVRFRGLELAVATLAIGLIFERLAFRNIGKLLSGAGASTFSSSFVTVNRPHMASSDLGFFVYSLVLASAFFGVVVAAGRGSIGRNMRAVREREAMASTLGINVVKYRAAAFVFSIAIASAAGSLFAGLKLGVTPDVFNIDLSFRLLAGAVIGGIASPGGAVIGGALSAVLPEAVSFGPLKVFAGERLYLLFGLGMIVTLWRRSSGLVGLLSSRPAARRSLSGESSDAIEMLPRALPQPSPRSYTNPLQRHQRPTLLRVDRLALSFGGVVALDGADISLPRGEIAALIGPNGAGKSTLFNCISGLLEPDSGRLYFDGKDVTELDSFERSALGIGRTYQTVEVFRTMTVLENLVVAGHNLRGSITALRSGVLLRTRLNHEIATRAHRVGEALGLSHLEGRKAAELPLGLLRVLELGMALMAKPKLLLLDEPSAGLDAAETRALAALIWQAHLDYDCSVLLVEHDMDFVSSIAEHVYVLDFGRVISQGTPAQIARDPDVIDRYLGVASRPARKGAARARR